MNRRSILLAGLILAGFAFAGTLLVVGTERITAERIARNQREFLLKSLHEVIPAGDMDNDLLADHFVTRIPELNSRDDIMVFRARKQGRPVAVILSPVIAKGYSGPIKLLVGIYENGTLAGVRVLAHQETPGLGDQIETSKSNWILGFRGLSLNNPAEKQWKVKRDGGVFDQFTGATITPRGVVKSVHAALTYFATHKERLFKAPAETQHKAEEEDD